jgi:hypothetical protein
MSLHLSSAIHTFIGQVSTGAFRGEQLTYIAALAANVPLVFGDRPKDVTYRWGHTS